MIWNYYDHEHIVGTHADHYRHVRILAEAEHWCFSQRSARLPFIPVEMAATQFSYLIGEDRMRSFHFGPFGLMLEQDFHFEDLAPQGGPHPTPGTPALAGGRPGAPLPGLDPGIAGEGMGGGCRVTVESRLAVPRIFGWLQPWFHRLMRRWFYAVWQEDMEMRARRLKVWQLGFRDFVGLDYVNRKTEGPLQPDVERPYPIQLPVPKITAITRGGISRPQPPGRKLGYGLPQLVGER